MNEPRFDKAIWGRVSALKRKHHLLEARGQRSRFGQYEHDVYDAATVYLCRYQLGKRDGWTPEAISKLNHAHANLVRIIG